MSKRNNKVSTLLSHRWYLVLVLHLSVLNLTLFGQVTLEIWEIQGTGNSSPFIGQEVITNQNVVTAVGSDFFFIQTPSNRSDDNPLTSDGLFIYTGSNPNLQAGDLVNVQGLVVEYEGMTEISGFGLIYEATGTAALPETVVFNNTFPGTLASTYATWNA